MIKLSQNIVIVCFKYPPVYSGYGKQLESVTEKLLEKNRDIHITLLTAYPASKENRENFKVVPLLSSYKDSNDDVYPFAIKALSWLFENRKQYSAIHCVKAGPEAIVSNIVSKILRKPLVVKVAQDEVSARELEGVHGLKRLSRKSRHWLLKSSNYFVAISNEINEDLQELVKDNQKIIEIPNGVNHEVFHPIDEEQKLHQRAKMNIDKDEIILLYAGALNRRKGTGDLLYALESLETDTPFRCILCGPILENEDEYLRKIEHINQSSNIQIEYRGSVSNTNEYMQVADIFILPSYSEGLPNVLLEAASTGLPLITTDIGGSRDIVETDHNGYVVETNAPDQIASRLKQLIEDKTLRETFGENSRELILNKYSLEMVSNQYIALYKSLTSH